MNLKRITRALAGSATGLLIFSPAIASNLMPLPETNTFVVSKNSAGYNASGEFAHYTSVGSGILISASKSTPNLVRVRVEEQADWRGDFTIFPALNAYLSQNPSLAQGAQVSQKHNESYAHPSAFAKVIPASQSYSFVFDLSEQAKRDQLARFLSNIAPGIMLADCALDNVLDTLKLH